MKKLFTLFIVCVMVLGVNAQKKVAYVTKIKTMDAAAAITDNDPIIRLLSADANFQVTILSSSDAAFAPDLSTYDIVIIAESWGSGDAIVKSTGVCNLTITKPMIYNKAYALRSGKAVTSGTAAAAEGGNEITVIAGKESNDLFKGITLTSGKFVPFVITTDDTGLAGVKATNYTTGNVISDANTLLATPTDGATAAVCINDMPAGTTIDGVTTGARIIFLSMNYGAMCANNSTNMTSACLTLWRNAAYIQAGIAVPTTAVDVLTTAPVTKTAKLSFNRIDDQITVNFGISQKAVVSVYNIAGMIVSKQLVNSETAQLDFSHEAKGIYIIKVDGSETYGTQKISVK